MTIDEQLRDIARRADRHQQVITAEEIVRRASSHGAESFAARFPFNDQRNVVNHVSVQFTEEEATMIDLEAPSQTDKDHKGHKRVLIAGLLAAAAVVAIAFVAIRNDDPLSPANQPSTTATPTEPPRALFGTPGEQLVPGTYFVDEVEGVATPRIFITLPAGWTNSDDDWGVGKEGIGFITFSRPDDVFLDACRSSDGFHPGPLTTLDGLVAALREQAGWAEVGALSDISVDGYIGKAFQRTAPAEFTGCSTSFAPFRSWQNDGPGGPGWSYYDPGEIETVWVLDVNGTIIVLNTRMWPDHQPAAASELAALRNSIRIERT
jgi:uncharacterized DUF497 family protein